MKLKTVLTVLGIMVMATVWGQSIVSINGALQVKENQLCNQYGYPVQLRGMSSHGLQWCGDCISSSSISVLRDEWGADIIRLAMYVEEGGYLTDKDGWKSALKNKTDAVINAGLYVIIDWHILQDGDPRTNQADAKDFFEYMSNVYAGVPNVIYEICNEPNGNGDDGWSTAIKPYAETIIPIIRANSPQAIVLVGTPKWSSKIGDILTDPLIGDNAKNVLYSFHFYSGSHFTQAYVNQFTDQLPIFADEWGTSSYTGNDLFNPDNATDWLSLFAGNNRGHQKISWCNWSFSDKWETSAALEGGSCGSGSWNSTTESGTYVKTQLQKQDNFISGILDEPRIAIHPFSKAIVLGMTAELYVSAIGADLTYQWYKDGTEITGETDAVLVLTDIANQDLGDYTVIVSNAYGSVESTVAELTEDEQKPSVPDTVFIPGTIETEQFDTGGEGIAFHDLDDTVSVENVDSGGFAIVGAKDNEWVEYTVFARNDANYKAEYLLKNTEEFPKIYLAVDGVAVTSIFNIPETGDAWKLLSGSSIFSVGRGMHVIRLIFENGENNGYLAIDNIQLKEVDCNGDDGGTAYYDHCGICAGGNTGIEPSKDSDGDGVYDCDDRCPSDPNKTEPGACGCLIAEGQCNDCNGDFGGTALVDNCDVCAGGNTGIKPNSTCFDCNGDKNGTADVDDCGICSGGLTGIVPNSYCTDCAGRLNGNAEIDDCGICAGGATGIIPNSTCTDCQGVVNGGAIVDDCGVCGGDGSSCFGVLTPYKGIRHSIPGHIEAEEYDAGGASVAYSDTDAGNNGNEYRTDDVDVADEGTGYCIGWTSADEYVRYSVTVEYSGSYTIALYGGTPGDGKTAELSLGNQTVVFDIPNTGSYQAFDTAFERNVDLTAGDYVLKFTFNDGGINFDYLEFFPEFSVDCNGDKNGVAAVDNCGVCAGGNTGVEPDKYCVDCFGVPNGTATIDECGICSGGATGLSRCFMQEYSLGAGWNIISTYVEPQINAVPDFFGTDASSVEVVKSNEQQYRSIYPAYLNSLPQIVPGEGYLVYVTNDYKFTISGPAIDLNGHWQRLEKGWNIIGFPKAKPELAQSALSSIWTSVEQIKDFGFFYNVSAPTSTFMLMPGKAYYVYVKSACSLYW